MSDSELERECPQCSMGDSLSATREDGYLTLRAESYDTGAVRKVKIVTSPDTKWESTIFEGSEPDAQMLLEVLDEVVTDRDG